MCTVSFVCSNGKVIITSNRDEQVLRPAIPPKNYLINQKNVFFPKDPKAGGTWYAVDENANVLVLLNGASEKHHWNPPYRKSRGLIVLDLIGNSSPLKSWKTIDLMDIEPFTLVLYVDQKLYQLRWNGIVKECLILNEKQNYVWSSATLYPKEVSAKRAEWFQQFLEANPEVTEEELYHFHRYTNADNQENGLVINRKEMLKTLSITQVTLEKNKVVLKHYDLIENEESIASFIIV